MIDFFAVNVNILFIILLPCRQKTVDIDVSRSAPSSPIQYTSTESHESCFSTTVEQSSNVNNIEMELEEIIDSEYAGNFETYMDLDSECDTSSTGSSQSDDCEDSEPDISENNDNQRESVPLYVLPPFDSIYSSEITHKEHLLSLCAFATKNHLSRTAFQQLMKLIDIHLPEKNLCETSVNKIKEKVRFQGNYFKFHEYCDRCGALYPDDKQVLQCSTPECTGTRNNKNGKTNYFVSGDMKTQLKEIFENEDNWNEITSSLKRCAKLGDIYDILDGRKYQEIKGKCKEMTVTLTMFTDGVSLFKSSKVSLCISCCE